jgi:hypothetical protein
MAVGRTAIDAVEDSVPKIIAAARLTREQVGVMTQCVDRKTLGRNTGTDWHEISLASLTAQDVTEQTELDNPQQLSDTLFTITPTVIGIHIFMTNRVAIRIARNVAELARSGRLAQNAIERKKDQDGLTAIDGFTTTLGAAGSSLTSGHIRAARTRITSNSTEPAPDGDIFGVFHGFQMKDIEDELLQPSSGALAAQPQSAAAMKVFTNGFVGKVGTVIMKEDGNLTIDSDVDAKGGVFHRQALVLVQGRSPYVLTRQEPHIGGGGVSIFHYDEYAYGERSSGNWGFEVISDATAPTS